MAFAVSAVVAAVAAPTFVSVMGAVAAVGMATSVVGIVTGKQNLIKIGGELGLVGGLGSLAAGALASQAANVVGVAEGEAAGAFSDVAGEKFAMDQAANAAGTTGAATSGAAGAAGNAIEQAATTAANNVAPLSGGAIPPGIDSEIAGYGKPGLSLPGAESVATTSAANTAATAPANLSQSAVNDAYSDVAGEKFAIANGGTANGQLTGIDALKAKLGAAWDKLPSQSQADLIKAAVGIPAAMKNNQLLSAQNDIANQRMKQTSYGSEVPTFGIINKAMKKG